MFSDTDNAAGLLLPYLSAAVAGSLRWSTLTHWPGRFVSDDWRGREADLVFSAERQGKEEPALVYVLLEHQSTPRHWMALRVLNYCLQIWVAWQGAPRNKKKTKLPLTVPVDRTAVLMAEVSPEGEVEVLARHVEYVLATQSEEGRRAFSAALQRHVPGHGGELMNYVEQIEERGRQEGLQEGRQQGHQEGRREGVLRTIEGFLRRDVPWSTIEEATSIDETEFERLKQQLDAAASGADQPN